MSLPLSKRDFDIFLSHAHKDKSTVAMLDRWLTEKAGLRVWYDSRELSGGALLATDLQIAIERCRGILLIASEESLSRGWVKAEYNSAMDERANDDGFRVVALRLGDANVSGLMRGVSWIDLPATGLDQETALAVVRAFYPGEKWPNPATARDVYISCSWRSGDSTSARAVCHQLVDQGFRLIGDARDQKGFAANDRVERIIKSCGAFVGIIPFRQHEVANPTDSPYKYFIREIDIAQANGLPLIIICDPQVRRGDGPDETWLRMETDASECPSEVVFAFESLWDEWRNPLAPQYAFCALDLNSNTARAGSAIRHLIERVTGMPTIVGNEIHEEPRHTAIIKRIRDAFLVLADITDDNINACIEAGMALAAGTNVELLSSGNARRPPFMLRSLQMSSYKDEVEQVGIVHKIVRPYRRRIINTEL
jgi:sugar phosphate isomerase/epimerase